MKDETTRRRTSAIVPGTMLALDWGTARCIAEAIVVGGEHALVLSPAALRSGTELQLENHLTGETTRFSVIWCGPADGDGRCKLGLKMTPEPAVAEPSSDH